jgi:hypothetical protein
VASIILLIAALLPGQHAGLDSEDILAGRIVAYRSEINLLSIIGNGTGPNVGRLRADRRTGAGVGDPANDFASDGRGEGDYDRPIRIN